MVGRDGELAALRRAWEGAVAGAGGVALVEGAAGVGKSRLAQELVAHALAGGARVATGHALDIDEPPPFGPWADALRQLVRACPAPPGAAVWPEDLARLCPAVEAAWGRHPGPAPAEPALGRARLFEAVAEAVEWCSRDMPLLLGLEDAHRADPASLALLAHLGTPLCGARALVVATVRTGAGADGLDRARDALARRGGLRAVVALGPLAEVDVVTIARREAPGLGDETVAQVAAAAEGNPLLALHAARAAAAGGDPEDGLRETVRAPLARLSPAARELVAAAAAAGRALSVPEAVALSGPVHVDQAVAEGVACGLLDPDAVAGVAFTHDLVRRACYGELPAGRRRAAHARLAEIIAAGPGRPPSEVAHHLLGAGDHERARAYLMAAAASARTLGALDQAGDFLREAIASAASSGAVAAQAEAWLALAEIEAWRGDRTAIEAAFGRVRLLYRQAGDVGALAAALAERSRWLRTTTCYPEEALRSSREALRLLDESGIHAPETRLLAEAGIVWGEAVAGDPLRAEALLAEMEEKLGDDDVLRAEMILSSGFALVRAGEAADARKRCRAAAEVAERTGRPALALDARIGEAACAAAQGLIPDVLEILARAPDPSCTGPGLACQNWAGLAHALSRLGRHDAAVDAAREEVHIAERFGSAELEAAAAADLGMTLLAAGRAEEARQALERALLADEARTPRAALRLAAAEAALAAGDPDAARAHLDRFPFEPVGPGDDPPGLIARLDRVTGLHLLASGRAPEGLARLEAAERRWERLAAVMVEDARGEQLTAVMLDLGRPPVAGLADPARELARIAEERRRALAATAVPAGGG
jgi:tetratricopeptide (TPR) repeat protein